MKATCPICGNELDLVRSLTGVRTPNAGMDKFGLAVQCGNPECPQAAPVEVPLH